MLTKVALPVIRTRVFAANTEGGNPCPVIFQGESLSEREMCEVAKHYMEETTFVFHSKAGADVKLRYFVPEHEMEMCVHATIASITTLLQKEFLSLSTINVETALGMIRVHGKKEFDKSIQITVEQFLPQFNKDNPNIEKVAHALGIEASFIDLSVGPIQSVSTSRPKLIIPLKDPGVLNNLVPNYQQLWNICDQLGTTGFYPFSIDKEGLIVSTRQFPNRAGYNEDPATGVAASALGAYLTQHQVFRPFSDGWNSYQIRQGYAMKKPSMIVSEVLIENGAFTRTQVKGKAFIESEEVYILDRKDL